MAGRAAESVRVVNATWKRPKGDQEVIATLSSGGTVILDVVLAREPRAEDAARLLAAIHRGEHEASDPAHARRQLTTIFHPGSCMTA